MSNRYKRRFDIYEKLYHETSTNFRTKSQGQSLTDTLTEFSQQCQHDDDLDMDTTDQESSDDHFDDFTLLQEDGEDPDMDITDQESSEGLSDDED